MAETGIQRRLRTILGTISRPVTAEEICRRAEIGTSPSVVGQELEAMASNGLVRRAGDGYGYALPATCTPGRDRAPAPKTRTKRARETHREQPKAVGEPSVTPQENEMPKQLPGHSTATHQILTLKEHIEQRRERDGQKLELSSELDAVLQKHHPELVTEVLGEIGEIGG